MSKYTVSENAESNLKGNEVLPIAVVMFGIALKN
jgi:hypothetical protein